MPTRRRLALLGVTVMALALTGCFRTIPQGYDGSPADGASAPAGQSDEGDLVSYTSLATNLVPDDTNGVRDVFVSRMSTGTTERVSVSSTGEQANGESTTYQQLSGDGRFVVFVSAATNLAPDDTNGTTDVFVRDLRRRTTELVSLDPAGRQLAWIVDRGPSISDDGSLVAFTAYTRFGTQVTYLRDVGQHVTRPVPGDPLPSDAAVGELSGDGTVLGWYRYDPSLFTPTAPVFRDLVTGDDDQILADRLWPYRYTLRLDRSGRYAVWAGASYDGRSEEVVVDRSRRTVTRLDAGDGAIASPAISATGRYVSVFRGPVHVDGTTLYVYDRVRHRSRLVGTGWWMTLARSGESGVVTPLDQNGPYLWIPDSPWAPGLP